MMTIALRGGNDQHWSQFFKSQWDEVGATTFDPLQQGLACLLQMAGLTYIRETGNHQFLTLFSLIYSFSANLFY